MKFVPGVPLSLYRLRYAERHGAFPAAEAVRVLGPVAAALDYAHGKGVVHRDVKPENVLVRAGRRRPPTARFRAGPRTSSGASPGSARWRWETSGTMAYMAPEQWRGRPQDGKTDQYALAAVAFELLTGHPPFDVPDKDQLARCVLAEPPPDLAGDPARAAVLARGLAKDPADRFPTCAALIAALANPPPPPPRVVPKPPAPAARGVLWGLVQSVLAAVAIFAGVWYFTRPTNTTVGPSAPTQPQGSAAVQPGGAPPVTPPPASPPGSPPTNAPPLSGQTAVATPPPPLPQAPAGALSADEQADAKKALLARLTPLSTDAEGWRNQLTGLTAPGETPEAAALHKKLLAARNAFSQFADRYAPLGTELRASPPQTRAAAAALTARLDALGAEQVDGRTLAEWKTAAAEDHAAYARLLADAESARRGNLAQFADRVRATAKALCAAAEAADTRGFDADTAAVRESRKTLLARRKEVRDAVAALALIEREVVATTPPDRTRLAELQATLRGLTIPDAAWCQETAQMARLVKEGAEAARLAFDARRMRLVEANEEAQWFVCTDANKQPIRVLGADQRRQLTTEGRAPWLHDDPEKTIHFSGNFAPGRIKTNTGPLELDYTDESGAQAKVVLDVLRKDAVAAPYARGLVHEDSAEFAVMAGRLRQQHVPYSSANKELVAQKKAEMEAALATLLNAQFSGLDLTPNEVSVLWETADRGGEKAVMLRNTFGGFRAAVVIPKSPPPGLVGDGDAGYRALVEEARRLAKGGPAAPTASAAPTAGSVWRGTLTQRGQSSEVVVTFSEVGGGIVRGRIENRGRKGGSGANTVAFTGVTVGADVVLVTRAPATGNPLLGAEWKGRVDGNALTGRWDYGTDDGGEFKLAREQAAP